MTVAAQQPPDAMGTGYLWQHFAGFKSLETGRQMSHDFVPTRWGERSKSLAPYPLGQAFSVFAINGVGVGHCFFRQRERFFSTTRAEDDFSAGGGKPIGEDESLLAKTLGQRLLLGHTRQSSVLLAQLVLCPGTEAIANRGSYPITCLFCCAYHCAAFL